MQTSAYPLPQHNTIDDENAVARSYPNQVEGLGDALVINRHAIVGLSSQSGIRREELLQSLDAAHQ